MKELFVSAADASQDTELFTPMPDGYRRGRTKYIIVFGTVMSGLGKGIFASSLAKLLQDKGLAVAPIKLEGYLNIDSGTLNPFRHGEVFVLDDGMETDMDLGTYERMLDQKFSRLNFVTSGQIFQHVLEKERKGGYLGRDVQMIPHVTGEVKQRLRELAMQSKADVVFVEIGGTVGDVENAYYIEAVRELAFEEGPGSACFVALTYVLTPSILGEQKSKAAQLGLKRLMEHGIQPHIVACRADQPVTRAVRQKIALYSNVPVNRVISMHDAESIYTVPEMLRLAGLDQQVIDLLGLRDQVSAEADERNRHAWSKLLTRLRARKDKLRIGITGKYVAVRDAYASIINALEHAGAAEGVHVEIEWIETTDVTEANVADALKDVAGIIVPGGFGKRGTEGKITCIRYARENNLPYLGLCLGFQMAVIEYARNVCGLTDANSTEFNEKTDHPVIDILPEQQALDRMGATMRLGGQDVEFKPETRAWELYGKKPAVRLRFRHRYEVHPDYIEQLRQAGLIFSGKAPGREIMQILELPDHPFFIGTQAHPCLTSRPLRPDSLFTAFVHAAKTR